MKWKESRHVVSLLCCIYHIYLCLENFTILQRKDETVDFHFIHFGKPREGQPGISLTYFTVKLNLLVIYINKTTRMRDSPTMQQDHKQKW